MESSRCAIGVAEVGPADWRLWRTLRHATLADAPAAFNSTLAEWSGPGDTEERWRARLSSVALNLVLTWCGEPAGMVSAMAPDQDGAVLLMSLWIAPPARGEGVADVAIRRVGSWARDQPGYRHLLLSVKADNTPAILLYRRHGFVDSGPVPDHPDERRMCQCTTPSDTTPSDATLSSR
jgi:ribosomal protein S18 acetylase RimI-like enzyme